MVNVCPLNGARPCSLLATMQTSQRNPLFSTNPLMQPTVRNLVSFPFRMSVVAEKLRQILIMFGNILLVSLSESGLLTSLLKFIATNETVATKVTKISGVNFRWRAGDWEAASVTRDYNYHQLILASI